MPRPVFLDIAPVLPPPRLDDAEWAALEVAGTPPPPRDPLPAYAFGAGVLLLAVLAALRLRRPRPPAA